MQDIVKDSHDECKTWGATVTDDERSKELAYARALRENIEKYFDEGGVRDTLLYLVPVLSTATTTEELSRFYRFCNECGVIERDSWSICVLDTIVEYTLFGAHAFTLEFCPRSTYVESAGQDYSAFIGSPWHPLDKKTSHESFLTTRICEGSLWGFRLATSHTKW